MSNRDQTNMKNSINKKKEVKENQKINPSKKRIVKSIVKINSKMDPSINIRSNLYKTRLGRGFSRNEILKSGISVLKAKKMSLRIDYRRSTVYPDNLSLLKKAIGKNK